MSHRFSSRSVLLAGLSAVAAALLVPVYVQAQGKDIGSKTELTRLMTQHRNRFEQLITGGEKPGPEDKAVLDTFAQWHIYRMTWMNLMGLAGTERSKLPIVASDLDNQVRIANDHRDKNNLEFLKQWTVSVVKAFDEVFKEVVPRAKENRIALVNTALLLPIYAKLRQEQFGEYLEKLLADPKQHEIVKLYAVKGLREYFHPTEGARAHKPSDDPDDMELKKEIERDTRRVMVLLNFLNRKWDGVDPAAAQFIRREAIQTLALARVPAMDVQKKGKVVAPVSYALLRVLVPGKDGLNPPPSLPEKVEAAIAIFKLKAKDIDAYQPEPGLYLAGQCLKEFVNKYREDFPNFGSKAKGKDFERKVPIVPWKMEANRLIGALKEIQKGLRDDQPAHANAAKFAQQVIPVLSQIQVHGQVTGLPAGFDQFLERAFRTKTGGALFKGSKEYQVDLAGGAGD